MKSGNTGLGSSRLKVGLTPHKKFVLFASLKSLENDEKSFLFYLKSSFRSQDSF